MSAQQRQEVVDDRKHQRRPLRANALFMAQPYGSIRTKTIDVSEGGVCISLPINLPVGVAGDVKFEMFVNERKHIISAKIEVAQCIFSTSDEFKTGLKFTRIDTQCIDLLKQFVK